MKLKIFFVPVMIIITMYLVIFRIVPEYNGPDGITESQGKLEVASARLADMKMREENAAKLASQLNPDDEWQKVVKQYLPEKKQDQDIVQSLDSIASSEGVLITNLALGNVPVPATPTAIEEKKKAVDDFSENTIGKSNESLTKDFDVIINLSGSYDNIRKFVNSMSTLNRFENIRSLDINRSEKAESQALVAKITVKFNYLDKITSVTNVDKKVFQEGEFDVNVATDIKDKSKVKIPDINIGSSGRTDPFSL